MKTTKEAFKEVINKKGAHKKLGISMTTIKNYRHRLKHFNSYPSEEKMSDILTKAGYSISQERKWQKD